jgi:hypothetical protein
VHTYPPQAPQPPCVLLLAGSPWIEPRGHVNLDVVALANPAGGNVSASQQLEELVEKIRTGLNAAAIRYGNTEPPATEIDAGVLSARTPTVYRADCV